MRPTADSTRQEEYLKDRLLYIKTRTEAGDYGVALAAVRKARTSWTDSVYLSALERQVGNLLSLSNRHALSEERKAEFLEPLSGIIDCALARLDHRRSDPIPEQAPEMEKPADAPLPAKENSADTLKVEYFRQASQFLTKGEYQLALTEIRRVYVIDPDNAMARQYESIIEKLQSANSQSDKPKNPPVAEARPVSEPATAIDLPDTEAVAVNDDGLTQHAPIDELLQSFEKSEETDTREITVSGSTSGEFVPYSIKERAHAEPRPSVEVLRSRRNMIAMAVLLVCGVGIAYMLLSSHNDKRGPGSESTTAATSQNAVKQPAEQTATDNNQPENARTLNQNSGSNNSANGKRPELSTRNQERAARNTESSKESVAKIASSASFGPGKKAKANEVIDIMPEELHVPTQGVSTEGAAATQQPASEKPIIAAAAPETEPEPFVAVEKEAQIVKLEMPEIPDIAWQGNSEIRVVARVKIDKEGKPIGVQILKSSTSVIEKAVVEALLASKFTPGIMGKAAVVSSITIPLKFKRAG